MSRNETTTHRILDILLRLAAVVAVILGGVAVAAGMIWFPKYVESYRNNAGWISFSVFSCFVFYSAAVFFKASWHRISYWTALTGLAALHVFLYLHIADIAAMKPGTFTIVSIFEVPALISVLYVAGFRDEENGGLTNRRGS